MKESDFIELVVSRGLVVLDDTEGYKICHVYNPEAWVLQIRRAFLAGADPYLLNRMINAAMQQVTLYNQERLTISEHTGRPYDPELIYSKPLYKRGLLWIASILFKP